jgi:hypothetical protein
MKTLDQIIKQPQPKKVVDAYSYSYCNETIYVVNGKKFKSVQQAIKYIRRGQ